MRRVGVLSQAQPLLKPQETFSRDSAAIKEAYTKVTSTHSGRGTAECSIQNIVLNRVCKKEQSYTVHLPPFFVFPVYTSVPVIAVFSSRKINHCGLF